MPWNNDLFDEIDETIKFQVKLGNDNEIELVNKETLDAHNKQGDVKIIQSTFYIFILKENILSVCQLIEKNYKLLFDNGAWKLFHKNTVGKLVAITPKIENIMFFNKDASNRLKWFERNVWRL